MSVVTSLTSHKIQDKDLPSQSCNFSLEARQVSKQQTAHVLSGEKIPTLLREGPTKTCVHIYGVKLATETETLTAGLREISNATAMDLFKTPKTSLTVLNRHNLVGTAYCL